MKAKQFWGGTRGSEKTFLVIQDDKMGLTAFEISTNINNVELKGELIGSGNIDDPDIIDMILERLQLL